MNADLIQIQPALPHYNKYGSRIIKYTIELYHKSLKERKTLSAPDIDTLKDKINIQINKWNILYKKEASIEKANFKSKEACDCILQLDNLLLHSIDQYKQFDWNKLKKNDEFPEIKPQNPCEPPKLPAPLKPNKELQEFTPTFTLLETIFPFLKKNKILSYNNKYSIAIADWEKQKQDIDLANAKITQSYNLEVTKWKNNLAKWEEQRSNFLTEQQKYNNNIDEFKRNYLSKNKPAICEYCELILNNSEYPDFFPKNFDLDYNEANKILVIDYELPRIDAFPRIKDVKFISTKNELKESYISDSHLNKIFDDTIYKTTLRSLYELFQFDSVEAVESISFNGWVKATNKATGKEETNCILSIQVTKHEYTNINLKNVDPKLCFKNLKGVSSSKLSSLTPVQPILQIDRNDKRFINSHSISGTIDNSTNLAAMDWEDFEHLIREIFEKEFQSNGGEVKVTQASRDGGVDAIAFDPDPIRGGKIVIQAKRYTNTVELSAVRDLYGTIVNEGATKGILVSTADYGPDAYDFAKGKPITLLNGSNLLHLLAKHGHHAKIDIKEAKRILTTQQ